MQPRPTKLTIKVKGKVHEIVTSTIQRHQDNIEKDRNALDGPNVPSNIDSKGTDQNTVDVSSSDYSTDNEDIPSYNDPQNQLVVYDHSMNGSDSIDPVDYKSRPCSRNLYDPKKVLPVIGAFTVQCAKCFKWRLIPGQERYEKIREHISVNPFTCESAREWQPDVSCDDPTDIEQDGTRIWAIDKPDIAQPPPGWKRLLQIRSEGSSKFADVYYTSPTGSKLRSMPDVQRYLYSHPEHAQGIRLAQFSFQIPRPLRQNNIGKRPAQMPAEAPGSHNAKAVEPIAWAGPDENSDVQVAEPLAWAGPQENADGAPRQSAPYTKKARSAS